MANPGTAAVPRAPLKPARLRAVEHRYTVTPGSFATLPEPEQRKKVGAFLELLRAMTGPARITLARKVLDVPVGGSRTGMPVLQVRISSGEPLGVALESLRYEYAEDLGGGGTRLVREHLDCAQIEAGGAAAWARCFTLASVPRELPWGWLATSVFPACHEASAWIEPVPHAEALARVRRRRDLIYEAARRSRGAADEYAALGRAEESMRASRSGLYRCRTVCTVAAAERRGLRAAARALRGAASASGASFAWQRGMQGAMLEGWGKPLEFDLGSMSCLYPFVSGDMLEVPNGLALGINADSGAPVIFDFARRSNYSMAVIGTSGSGKSFTAKMVLRRLLERHPDSLCFVIDPMGEYHSIAPSLGLGRVSLTGGGSLGLDPFRLLDPADAADILGRVTRAPEDVVKQFRRFSDRAGSVEQLHRSLDPPSRRWLDDLVEGPLAGLMRGEPDFPDRLVMSMRRADGKPHEAMLLVLALARVWRRIEEMPQGAQKIVLLDEAWMLFKMEGASRYVEQIVRMGRKRNVIFLFVSQNVGDVAGGGGAPRIIDNMETKVLMSMEEDAADESARVLGLSAEECSRLKSFEPGHAILITKKHRLHVRLEPSAEELALFDTSP